MFVIAPYSSPDDKSGEELARTSLFPRIIRSVAADRQGLSTRAKHEHGFNTGLC
jgi:hypothetical protein